MDRLPRVWARDTPSPNHRTDNRTGRSSDNLLCNQPGGLRQRNAETSEASKQIHFILFGTPEIDLTKFGPKDRKPIVCVDGGKPNQLTTPDAARWGY